MSKPFILVADGMDQEIFDQLLKFDFLEVHPNKKCTPEEIQNLRSKINGIVIRSATTIDKEFIDNAPNLKYVIRAGEGTDNIDKTYCAQKGIKVSNTPGANSNSAAEHAISLIFSVLRHCATATASIKENKWEKSSFTGLELWKKTIGIIGFGRIGQIVAKRLSGFDINLIYLDSCVAKDFPHARKAETLDELLENSDIISIHLPLTKETKNYLGKNEFRKMKKNAILVNAARGGIINEDELYESLINNEIYGAGLDVFTEEPLKESKLRSLNNIVLTPHLGASTQEAQVRVGEMTLEALESFFNQNNLLFEVK